MYIFFYDIITLGVDNMFFIGGISNEEKKLDYVQNTICPKCGKFSRMEVYMTYMYFSLFFVPIFKWSKKYFVKYTCCNSIYILDEDIGIKINHKENISISDDNLHYVDNDFSLLSCFIGINIILYRYLHFFFLYYYLFVQIYQIFS